jgi:hypothetical protein
MRRQATTRRPSPPQARRVAWWSMGITPGAGRRAALRPSVRHVRQLRVLRVVVGDPASGHHEDRQLGVHHRGIGEVEGWPRPQRDDVDHRAAGQPIAEVARGAAQGKAQADGPGVPIDGVSVTTTAAPAAAPIQTTTVQASDRPMTLPRGLRTQVKPGLPLATGAPPSWPSRSGLREPRRLSPRRGRCRRASWSPAGGHRAHVGRAGAPSSRGPRPRLDAHERMIRL